MDYKLLVFINTTSERKIRAYIKLNRFTAPK